MRSNIFILVIFIFTATTFATIPPKTGIKAPAYFSEFHRMIQSEYSQGYYAQKMRERKEIREQISLGNYPQSVLEQDTTFALTLLGEYSNLPSIYSQQSFQSHLFDGPNPSGTITDYYLEVSYEQMYFTGDCQGWYQVPGTLEQYEGGNSGMTPQGGPRFVLDLVIAADPTLNFADYIQYYDGLGRPHIGFVAAIHTGGDAAAGAVNIWSHRWNFRMLTGNQYYVTNDIDPVSGQAVLIDGDYAIQPELSGSNNNSGSMKEIGVFTHEFGHIFGLPDLYDTDNSSEGLGNWCLMAGGSYGGNSSSANTPVHMSAWCKKEMGWVTPINITSALDALAVPNVEENDIVYRMWKNGSFTAQYFLIENRQKIGFDVNLYDAGFLIFHVDETQNNNTNENRYLVDLEQADGMRHLNQGLGRGDAGDPFPGVTLNTRFDINTNPNSDDYSSQNTYVSVRNIYKDGLMMVGDFDIGTQPYIELNDISISEVTPHNGRIEAGETGSLNFELHNMVPANSANTTVEFFIDEPGIQVNQNEVSGAINGLSTQTLSIQSALTVAPNFQSKMIKIRYEIISEGNSIIDSTYIAVGIPEILLISRAEKESLGDYYKSSLLELDNFYEETYNSSIEYILNRKAIIIFTGRSLENIFTQAEIDSLNNYLNNGGNIFFSGQNLAENLEADYPNFLHNTVGVSWDRNTILSKHAYGKPGDLFGDQFADLKFSGNEGANNEVRVDVLNPIGSFNTSSTYKSNGTDPAGGWNLTSNNGKIFFLGFGFESINNNESTVTRTQVLDGILQWFELVTDVSISNDITVLDYSLYQNYPNPFNPSTLISYQLPAKGFVTLKVYDVLGNEVSLLVNEERSAGRNEVEFNGNGLSSGVYFYTLKSGNFSNTKKFILMK